MRIGFAWALVFKAIAPAAFDKAFYERVAAGPPRLWKVTITPGITWGCKAPEVF